MKTMIFWHKEKKPKDWQEGWSLPMGFFDCDRLEKCDILRLAMTLDGEQAKVYKVKVASVEISPLYRPWINDTNLEITQWVDVRPSK